MFETNVNNTSRIELNDNDVGLEVIAIGNPQGLSNTVSTGIVSAVRRVDSHTTVIQTTAPISPGSSGGGLFDLQSRLIGITSFLHTGGQSLNFAYPARYIKPLLKNTPSSPFYQLARNKVNNSTSPEIVIAGIPTRKESLAAVFLSIPENKAEVKVIPDLETPGITASD